MFQRYFTLIIIAILFNQSLFADCNLSARFNYKTNSLLVTFANSTVGNYNQLTWNFGDGTTSQEANPIHTYTSAGTYQFSLTATTPDGCQSTTTAKVYVFNNKKTTKQAALLTQVTSYPNPIIETCQLSFTSQTATPATITINDLNGKVVSTIINNQTLTIGNNTFTISRNNLPSGMYFVNIVGQNQVITHKIEML
ncbi:MAG: T9SS type A sorting domain-containing protein [Chitinophagales bacterium]|nr:T9SS type A sorting domain-containing protein [Sphingobacteriales bacterium]MBP7533317.1 T9SS type A sorting domain-containing protein [Chitinophagales bacterium]